MFVCDSLRERKEKKSVEYTYNYGNKLKSKV